MKNIYLHFFRVCSLPVVLNIQHLKITTDREIGGSCLQGRVVRKALPFIFFVKLFFERTDVQPKAGSDKRPNSKFGLGVLFCGQPEVKSSGFLKAQDRPEPE